MTEKQVHHIQPKYLIGEDNSPDNLTPPISIDLHAALHKDLYEHYGNTEDFVAWKKLSKQSLKGITFTPEVRKKMSEAKIGRKLSEETRKKMSLAAKGKKKAPRSDEWKRKQSLAHKGNKLSKETCEKMSRSQMGHPVSLNTRLKISETEKQTKAALCE